MATTASPSIDTKTRNVFGVMTLDIAPENNLHAVAVRDDGGLLVTDMADKAVRVVDYQRGNTAPVALANPSVALRTRATGAICGAVNIKDWDGDALTLQRRDGADQGIGDVRSRPRELTPTRQPNRLATPQP